jgi:serralysin
MFDFYATTALISSPVDALSIMMYPIPKSWTTDGFSAGLNSALTDTDRALIRSVYPR